MIGFRESATIPIDARQSLFEDRLKSIEPTWRATNLGRALATAAEDLEASQTDNPSGSNLRKKQVIVISDLQTGSRLDALQRYEWPVDVEVQFAKTDPRGSTNAGLQRVADNNDLTASASELRARVRVTNAADSTHGAVSASMGIKRIKLVRFVESQCLCSSGTKSSRACSPISTRLQTFQAPSHRG